ncbi:MAG: reverse transcriptase domain-containing protein [Christensenellaceae bacterium]
MDSFYVANSCRIIAIHYVQKKKGVFMTNQQRRENRFQRRKLQRINKDLILSEYGNFDKVFSWEHLRECSRKCMLGVGWKHSTQMHKLNELTNMTTLYKQLHDGTYKSKGFYEFDIFERGKERHIQSVHITERIVQKCLSDYCLVPILSRKFIYDNGACIKNKGIDFAVNRLINHLHVFYRKYKTDGYILQFDFSKYFENINHKKLKEMIAKEIPDRHIVLLTNMFIDNFNGERGLGLGSQVSQICALFYPNEIDHAIKEKMGVKYYGRYMDDAYLISESKEKLIDCLNQILRLCDKLEIKINKSKTVINKLSRPFTFLKKKFILTESGKVVVNVSKSGTKAMRRKLNFFKKQVEAGKLSIADVVQSYNSWDGHVRRYNTHTTRFHMRTLFYKMFKEYLN